MTINTSNQQNHSSTTSDRTGSGEGNQDYANEQGTCLEKFPNTICKHLSICGRKSQCQRWRSGWLQQIPLLQVGLEVLITSDCPWLEMPLLWQLRALSKQLLKELIDVNQLLAERRAIDLARLLPFLRRFLETAMAIRDVEQEWWILESVYPVVKQVECWIYCGSSELRDIENAVAQTPHHHHDFAIRAQENEVERKSLFLLITRFGDALMDAGNHGDSTEVGAVPQTEFVQCVLRSFLRDEELGSGLGVGLVEFESSRPRE